jgi:hypothetical protein
MEESDDASLHNTPDMDFQISNFDVVIHGANAGNRAVARDFVPQPGESRDKRQDGGGWRGAFAPLWIAGEGVVRAMPVEIRHPIGVRWPVP